MSKIVDLDLIDVKILDYLKNNSKMQLKEIGERVHFSGPAVASRIKRMESLGIIKRFTIDIDENKLEQKLNSFIILHMNSNNHKGLQKFVHAQNSVKEAHKISGHGCYLFNVSTHNQEELNKFLDDLSLYGTYQLNMSIQKIK